MQVFLQCQTWYLYLIVGIINQELNDQYWWDEAAPESGPEFWAFWGLHGWLGVKVGGVPFTYLKLVNSGAERICQLHLWALSCMAQGFCSRHWELCLGVVTLLVFCYFVYCGAACSGSSFFNHAKLKLGGKFLCLMSLFINLSPNWIDLSVYRKKLSCALCPKCTPNPNAQNVHKQENYLIIRWVNSYCDWMTLQDTKLSVTVVNFWDGRKHKEALKKILC